MDFQIKEIKRGQKAVKCPVCKRMNDKKNTQPMAVGNQTRYCCPGCVEEFIDNVKKTSLRICSGCKGSFQLKVMTNTKEIDANGEKTSKKLLLCPECYKKHLLKNSERALLIETICNIFGYYTPPMFIPAQIKRLTDEYGFTIEEIRQSLVYYFIINENVVRNGDGIGIVVHVYNEAMEFYKNKNKIDERNKAFNEPKFEEQKVTITLEEHNPRLKKHKLIDISSIGQE